MPSVGWNQRFVQVGNGAFAGTIYTATIAARVAEGYAAAGTDDGSESNGSWEWLADPDRLKDFGYRAVHLTALNAKAIIQAYYDAAPIHSYFVGESKGGQEAMMEAQRFPADFDGIIAMFPGFYATHLMASLIWNAQRISILPETKVTLIHKSVIRACIQSAGIPGDDFLTAPRTCSFDPAALRCRDGTDTPACLTAPQVAAVRDIYRGPYNVQTGKQVYGGEVPGSEAASDDIRGPYGWSLYGHLAQRFAQPFLANAVFHDPDWKWKTFIFDRDVELSDERVGKIVNAIDPDLEAFRARGGKLIMIQGWNDPLTPPLEPIMYYGQVVAAQEQTMHINEYAAGLERTRSFFRLFMVPGEGHGVGVGPIPQNPLVALVHWVERGFVPNTLIAQTTRNETANEPRIISRPICAYPQTAEWKGIGTVDDPANFFCIDDSIRELRSHS